MIGQERELDIQPSPGRPRTTVGRAAAVIALVAAAACVGGGDDPVAESRCDLGFNTEEFNEAAELVHHRHDTHATGGDVDFTLEDWARVFTDEELGMTTGEVAQAVRADDITRRHVLGGVFTHTLGPDPWAAMTSPEECTALADELGQAREVAARYPTVADAQAAGYTLGDVYNPGLASHQQNYGRPGLEAFDPGDPVQLLYSGTAPEAALAGLSYVVRSVDGPPEGFTGQNDVWHRHRRYCLESGGTLFNLSSDVLSAEECAAIGGVHTPNPDGWMLHVWVVPGCENDWGLFSGANPRLPYLPVGTSLEPGCNSGKLTTDPLDRASASS